jgi:thioredoxin 1
MIFEKKFILILAFLTCFSAKAQVISLPPSLFLIQLKTENSPKIIDLRTSKEFSNGHIKKSVNLDYSKENIAEIFENGFHKNDNIYLYCNSGTKSNAAAIYLSELGFEKIFVLEGGFEKWITESKPYSSDSKNNKPLAFMSVDNFNARVKENQYVLVDFYADWCGPCKKMDPILQKISRENPNVNLLKIDADSNITITEKFEVEEIPTLLLFKNGQQIWRNTGIVSENEIKHKFK